jgi:hypothetical protein
VYVEEAITGFGGGLWCEENENQNNTLYYMTKELIENEEIVKN